MATTVVGDNTNYNVVIFDSEASSSLPTASAKYALYVQADVNVAYQDQPIAREVVPGDQVVTIRDAQLIETWTLKFSLDLDDWGNFRKALAFWARVDTGQLFLYVKDSAASIVSKKASYSTQTLTQIRGGVASLTARLTPGLWDIVLVFNQEMVY